ncbi:hypothetical protein [Pelagicoccus sp. SDUM812003]|uniref:hypothetical protein n=1 Tax=Pelagicoccus sp. SDUM812003 TaxID=3041267 RepID=UPI00280F8E79|nr:hypothetical protein [Pelagicoccus sp. SDUM812003]MDQ8204788.1 hypothetical protein [Pelagicoccus sp. SDUM812003]
MDTEHSAPLIDQPPAKVEIRQHQGGFSLFRDGVPFFVNGAGGCERIEELAASGANSVRTWGIEQTQDILPTLRKTDLTLCSGHWLEPPRRGFDYADEAAVAEQLERIKREVLAIKDEPNLLLWGVGNELELGTGSDPDVWRAVEEVARFIKRVDGLHPVMTVLASADEASLKAIETLCPSLDLVGINSYGDISRVQPALDAIGWSRPYLITEWGSNGAWEVEKTDWGAELEPTSTEKAGQIRYRYQFIGSSDSRCLGSYVFLWGNKQETTHTWYGLFTPEGRATEGVFAISSQWKEQLGDGSCPKISAFRVNGSSPSASLKVASKESLLAEVEWTSPEEEDPEIVWSLRRESCDKRLGGDLEEAAAVLSTVFVKDAIGTVRFDAPMQSGPYRLFVEIRGEANTVATANFPFWVDKELS